MTEKCPVCSGELEPKMPACPHCGFKLLGSTQRFERVSFEDESFSTPAKPAAEAVLRVVRGPQTGVSYRLSEGAVQTVGRSPRCDVFLNDMTVSREHAAIEQADGGFAIRDMNSFNGVWVNNDNVEATRVLSNGDIIQIGAFCLLYQEE
ncbi:MAG: FHA domain-containing protein [Gordonibacter sp.]|uniref:FHA domain-containing protein n=1 Tax=Gordonibacter sp. TaxID=1968902 RepID=UPI002FCBD4D0